MERPHNARDTNRLLNEVTEYIADVEYPAHTEDLIETARRAGAPQRVINTLGLLPERTFQSHNDLLDLVIDDETAASSSPDDAKDERSGRRGPVSRTFLPDEVFQ